MSEPLPSSGGESPASVIARPSRRRIILVLALLLVAAVVIASAGGYFSGETARTQSARATVQAQAQEQFGLALEDMRAGRYSFARQRLEYVLSLDPKFPAADSLLRDALRAMNSTPTPTATPTPPPTATLDLPRAQQLFAQAEQQFNDKNWADMVQTLLTLRVEAPDFQPYRIDGLMFVALRNQGIALIGKGKPEEGLYYLDLAARYGPLDKEATDRANWARLLVNLYQNANFYFGRDWQKSVQAFAQVYAMAPYFGETPTKYPKALFGYGQELLQKGLSCGAVDPLQRAANLQPSNSDYANLLASASRDCDASRATAVPSPTPGGSPPAPTPTPTP